MADPTLHRRARELSRIWRAHQRKDEGVPHDVRIGFAGSFTIDPLVDYAGALLLQCGCANPLLANANYNQLVRTCLDPAGELGAADLDTIVLLWRLEDLADPTAPENIAGALQALLEAIAQLRANFSGTLILALPPRPRAVTEGLVTFFRPSALEALWFEALSRISALIQDTPNTYSLDLETQIAALGEAESIDYRKEILYRQPYSEAFLVRLAECLLRIHRAKRSEPKKCIVVDCDNTLWGGVIGEDGVGGVQLSDDYPGRAYLEFQRQLKVLRDSGIFLGLCSKNNPEDVREMFETHSSMAITLDDVSVSRVNWRPKSENLKEIAEELNIGLDALVFIDDDPFEIEEVGAHAPEVTSIQVPEDIADLPSIFRKASQLFDRIEVTADDRERVDRMRQEMGRRELSQKLTEAEFLAGLGLEIDLFEPSPSDQARVTQLINKTNQFNVTTRRYSFEQVAALAADPTVEVYCASVRDRFGDYGLVGVGILRFDTDAAVFDTMLMSCRVLGRGLETAMIAHGIELAAGRGVSSVIGHYVPTRKNAMVADLFEKHGFEAQPSDDRRQKTLVRSTSALQVPAFLAVHAAPAR